MLGGRTKCVDGHSRRVAQDGGEGAVPIVGYQVDFNPPPFGREGYMGQASVS